jgi:hypothetical protein
MMNRKLLLTNCQVSDGQVLIAGSRRTIDRGPLIICRDLMLFVIGNDMSAFYPNSGPINSLQRAPNVAEKS